jgi:DNA-binding transcriptional ArsR family regulator
VGLSGNQIVPLFFYIKNLFILLNNQKVFSNSKKYLDICLIMQTQNYIPMMNDVFKALNDPARREILKMLQKQDMTAGDIASKFDMSAPSISHHLDKLKRAGLVTTVKQGQFIHYSINTTIIDDILQYILTLKK